MEWQKKTAAALRDQLALMGVRQVPSNRDGFDDEFDALRALDQRVRMNHDEFFTASLGSNLCKNRYADVLPNEGTRVILDPINSRGDGDYINANYVDGRRLFGVPFVYIATQAPMRSTVGDFWRMVYENNTVFIVMLCAEIESGKIKSERYWPDGVGGVMNVGPLTLVLTSENHRNDTVFRTVNLRTVDGRERQVFHMQYVRWPDQGIPHSSAPLMEMVHALARSPTSTQTPIVVHCSGGVGRTGTFIALHVALALFQLLQPISVPKIVQYLKLCRTGMVQRKDQYLFTYYAILREMEKMIWAAESSSSAVSAPALALGAGPAAAAAAGGASPLARLSQGRPFGGAEPAAEGLAGAPSPYAAMVRRVSQHVPQHPAQSRADIGARSSLQPQQAPSGLRGADSSTFGPNVVSSTFEMNDFAPSGRFATAGGGGGSEVELALRNLQARNQQLRSKPKLAPHTTPGMMRRGDPQLQSLAARLALEDPLSYAHQQQQQQPAPAASSYRAGGRPSSSPPAQPQLDADDDGPDGGLLPPLRGVPQLSYGAGAAATAGAAPPARQQSQPLRVPSPPSRDDEYDATQRPSGAAPRPQPPARVASVERAGPYFFSPDPQPTQSSGATPFSEGYGSAAAAAAAPAAPMSGGAVSSDLAAATSEIDAVLFGTSAARRPQVARSDLSLL